MSLLKLGLLRLSEKHQPFAHHHVAHIKSDNAAAGCKYTKVLVKMTKMTKMERAATNNTGINESVFEICVAGK